MATANFHPCDPWASISPTPPDPSAAGSGNWVDLSSLWRPRAARDRHQGSPRVGAGLGCGRRVELECSGDRGVQQAMDGRWRFGFLVTVSMDFQKKLVQLSPD